MSDTAAIPLMPRENCCVAMALKCRLVTAPIEATAASSIMISPNATSIFRESRQSLSIFII
jgi:hypothetical protein